MSPEPSNAKLDLNAEFVRGLLLDQHPDLADLPIRFVSGGGDNALYRLGDDLVMRLPLRPWASGLLQNEQKWLPLLSGRLPIAVPAPVRIGRPGRGYVAPWFAGDTANQQPPRHDQAERLADFLRALHIPAPDDAPKNAYRGGSLKPNTAYAVKSFERLHTRTDSITPEVHAAWRSALDAPAATSVETRWLHGDLHGRNVVVEDGVISGSIDWGQLCAGDIANDLASIWMLFDDPRARRDAIARYAVAGDAALQRAKGWAVFFGVVHLDQGFGKHPVPVAMGEAILRRISDDG